MRKLECLFICDNEYRIYIHTSDSLCLWLARKKKDTRIKARYVGTIRESGGGEMKPELKNAEYFIGRIFSVNPEAATALMRIIDDMRERVKKLEAVALAAKNQDDDQLNNGGRYNLLLAQRVHMALAEAEGEK